MFPLFSFKFCINNFSLTKTLLNFTKNGKQEKQKGKKGKGKLSSKNIEFAAHLNRTEARK